VWEKYMQARTQVRPPTSGFSSNVKYTPHEHPVLDSRTCYVIIVVV